jgi:uncharacterized protein (TIGR00369 family)
MGVMFAHSVASRNRRWYGAVMETLEAPEGIESGATAEDAAQAWAERSPEITRRREVVWQDPMPSAAAGAELAGLDYMRALIAGKIPPPPIAVTMNFTPIEVSDGHAVFQGQPGEEHYNPIGVVHGGVAATLLDSCMGCAVQTHLPAGTGYTTLEIKINYVRALTDQTGPVRAEARTLHVGRRAGTAESKLIDAKGTLYAHGTTTCMIFPI